MAKTFRIVKVGHNSYQVDKKCWIGCLHSHLSFLSFEGAIKYIKEVYPDAKILINDVSLMKTD